MSADLAGQRALITGATGAIGSAVAHALAGAGAAVCLQGREQAALAAKADELHLRYPGIPVSTCAFDLAATDPWAGSEDAPDADFDLLIHCAGSILLKGLLETTVSDFDAQIATNLRGAFLLTQAVLPGLITRQGQIVFVNSSAARQTARSGLWAYTASKAGLKVLADALRDEVNAHGVRVMSIYPGRTASAMQAQVHAAEGRPFEPAMLLQPDDVASQILGVLQLPRTAEVTDIDIRPFRKS